MDAASLVSAWYSLIQQLAPAFTEPTARTWQQVALGWVLHRGPATVTGIYRTLGSLADRHWTVYHKFFYRAAWSLEAISARLLVQVVAPMILESGLTDAATGQPPPELAVDLHIDDTTAGRYGKHVAHAGWFKDASATGPATKGTVIHWAHNWIVGAITLRLPRWPAMRWALPVVFALYRKPGDCDPQHPFATRQVLAARMVCQVAAALPQVRIRVTADGQYATRDMINGLPAKVSFVSRLRRDAALYDLPPQAQPKGKRGRKPTKGKRLPTPVQLAARRKQGWQTITVQRQGPTVQRQILGITCLWYHVCRAVPIRLVIVRAPGGPAGKQQDDFFFCTDITVPDEQIVQRSGDRWGVEECILEAKQQLGFESTRGWCSNTVHHQAPLAMVLLTLVKAWYARCADDEPALLPQAPPWNPGKTHPSFLDMLAALRGMLWQHRISSNSPLTPRVHDILQTVFYTLSAAA
jgi:hypothetical protein